MKLSKRTKSLLYWTIINLITVIIIAVLGLVVMVLWNQVMRGIIICDRISFWESLGLIALAAILTYDKSKLFKWLYE